MKLIIRAGSCDLSYATVELFLSFISMHSFATTGCYQVCTFSSPRFVLPLLWLFLSVPFCRHVWLHWFAFARPTNKFFIVCFVQVFIFSFSGHVVGLSWLTRLCNIPQKSRITLLRLWEGLCQGTGGVSPSFHCGCGMLDRLFLLSWIFEISW